MLFTFGDHGRLLFYSACKKWTCCMWLVIKWKFTFDYPRVTCVICSCRKFLMLNSMPNSGLVRTWLCCGEQKHATAPKQRKNDAVARKWRPFHLALTHTPHHYGNTGWYHTWVILWVHTYTHTYLQYIYKNSVLPRLPCIYMTA